MSSLIWDKFGQHFLRYILFPYWYESGLVNTLLDTYCDLVIMEMVWSTHVGCILCPHRHWMGLFNTCSDSFCVLAVMGDFRSTQVNIIFEFSLAWNGFGQHMLRHILCPRHASGTFTNGQTSAF